MMMQKERYFSNMKELQENRKGLSIYFLLFWGGGHIHLIKHKIGVWGSRKVSVPGLTSQNHLRADLSQMPTSQRWFDFVWVILDTCNKEVFQRQKLTGNHFFLFPVSPQIVGTFVFVPTIWFACLRMHALFVLKPIKASKILYYIYIISLIIT